MDKYYIWGTVSTVTGWNYICYLKSFIKSFYKFGYFAKQHTGCDSFLFSMSSDKIKTNILPKIG